MQKYLFFGLFKKKKKKKEVKPYWTIVYISNKVIKIFVWPFFDHLNYLIKKILFHLN